MSLCGSRVCDIDLIFFQASYFIGIGANVVLCIQYLPDKCVIGSDEVSLFLSHYNVQFWFGRNLNAAILSNSKLLINDEPKKKSSFNYPNC